MKSTNKRINLDWKKLTGFNQVAPKQGERASQQTINAKIGVKVGAKPPPTANL